MDFLNKSFAQVKDLFEGMTPGSRILAGLLLAVVVISMGYLVRSGVTAGDTYLFDNSEFTSDEIKAMQVAFSTAGLNDAEIVGGKICVPRSERYLYLAALADGEALPQNLDQIIKESIQSLTTYASKTIEQAALRDAKDRYVGGVIAGSPKIETASVISDSASSRTGGLLRTSRTTVAVTVTPTGSRELKREDVQYIFHLVDKAYTEATLEDISITTTNGGWFQGSSEDDPTSGGGHLAKKREYEKHKETNIARVLSYIPGLLVLANVELDPKVSHVVSSVKPDEKSVATSVTESDSTQTSTSGSPGGAPGFPAQGGAMTGTRLATVAADRTGDTTTESESQINSLVGGETSRSEFAGLTPTRVTVSISIPDSYLEDVWRKQNPTEEGEEPKTPEPADLLPIETKTIADIEELVQPQLSTGYDGIGPAPAGNNIVKVKFFPSLTPDPLPEPSMVQGATGWLARSWQTLGMFGLALFSLMMLRSMVKSGQAPPTKAPPTEPVKSDESKPDEVEADVQKSLQPFGTSGASLKDELSDLVSDDPDAAANILKNWIGTTANMK